VIRLATLDELDPEVLQKLTSLVYQAYGLGCEYVGGVEYPEEHATSKVIDAASLLERVEQVVSFADDKVVYLTTRKLAPRAVPGGQTPTPGYSEPAKGRAVVTSHGLPSGEAHLRRLAKQVMHDIGHLWELHHCLDPRCAMHPPWTPNFNTGEPVLCTFCREKSEQRIRLAKT
jgi:archaemetzincin